MEIYFNIRVIGEHDWFDYCTKIKEFKEARKKAQQLMQHTNVKIIKITELEIAFMGKEEIKTLMEN